MLSCWFTRSASPASGSKITPRLSRSWAAALQKTVWFRLDLGLASPFILRGCAAMPVTFASKVLSIACMCLMLIWQSSSRPLNKGCSKATQGMSIAGRKVGAGLRTLPSWFQRFCQRPMVKFIVAWRAPGANPKRWIVSLHGSRGFATDDLAIWYPSLKGRDVGLISVQCGGSAPIIHHGRTMRRCKSTGKATRIYLDEKR